MVTEVETFFYNLDFWQR